MTMQNYDGRTALHVAAAQGIEGERISFSSKADLYRFFFSSLVR